MSAINFLMGDRFPMPGNIQDTDHYNSDPRRRVKIELHIDHIRYSKISFDSSRPQYCLQAYDRAGNLIRTGFTNAMREEIAFAYVDASRNFERHFSLSRWSLFGQSIRQLHDSLNRQPGNSLDQLREALAAAHALLRTELYEEFERHLKDAFSAQLRSAHYDVRFEFRTLDETNLYRNLFPTLIESGQPRSPSEVGSGVRNLLVLALFQAFARSFRGGAVLGIEEPELYLHPHAQRSLMNQFEALASDGNQIFISSHSSNFIDVTYSDRVVLVERCEDDEGEICTQVRTCHIDDLLLARQTLHPDRRINEATLRAYLRNVRTPEMTEPFFSNLVVIVEGQSEKESLPVYASFSGLNFDEYGVSIVSANGKTAIDTLYHLYKAHDIKVYVIFDNDVGQRAEDCTYNSVICRMLNIEETEAPRPEVTENYAVIGGNWEAQCADDISIGNAAYSGLVQEGRELLGVSGSRGKPLIARYVAQKLCDQGIVPLFVSEIIQAIRAKLPDRVLRVPDNGRV